MRYAVLAVRKWTPGSMGGLSAQVGDEVDPEETFECYARDQRYTRVQALRLNGAEVTVLRDETYPDRIDHPDEEVRTKRLDDLDDHTVRDVRSRDQ